MFTPFRDTEEFPQEHLNTIEQSVRICAQNNDMPCTHVAFRMLVYSHDGNIMPIEELSCLKLDGAMLKDSAARYLDCNKYVYYQGFKPRGWYNLEAHNIEGLNQDRIVCVDNEIGIIGQIGNMRPGDTAILYPHNSHVFFLAKDKNRQLIIVDSNIPKKVPAIAMKYVPHMRIWDSLQDMCGRSPLVMGNRAAAVLDHYFRYELEQALLIMDR